MLSRSIVLAYCALTIVGCCGNRALAEEQKSPAVFKPIEGVWRVHTVDSDGREMKFWRTDQRGFLVSDAGVIIQDGVMIVDLSRVRPGPGTFAESFPKRFHFELTTLDVKKRDDSAGDKKRSVYSGALQVNYSDLAGHILKGFVNYSRDEKKTEFLLVTLAEHRAPRGELLSHSAHLQFTLFRSNNFKKDMDEWLTKWAKVKYKDYPALRKELARQEAGGKPLPFFLTLDPLFARVSGAWKVTHYEKAGYRGRGWLGDTITFRKDIMIHSWKIAFDAWEHQILTLDSLKSPFHFDRTVGRNTTRLGICKLEHGKLTICNAPIDQPRPTTFSTTQPGGGQVLMILECPEDPRGTTAN